MAAKPSNSMNLSGAIGIVTWDGTSSMSSTGLTQYSVLTGGSTANAFNQIAPSTAGQLFTSAGATSQPTWTTSTYPGTNAINTLLYASSANVMGALATANSGVLATSASGVPSISTTPTVTSITFGSGSPLSIYTTGGTWTPAWSRTSLSTTYDNQLGYYTKVGNICAISCFLQVNDVSNAGSGNLTFTGLPFTVNASTDANMAFAVGETNIAFPSSTTYVAVDAVTNAATGRVFANVATTGAVSQAITLVSSNYIEFSGSYLTV